MDNLKEAYQTVGFHFYVSFTGLGESGDSVDGRFQSVSGFDVSLETESFKEGGENRFEHRVPVRTKYADLVLKRGLLLPSDGAAVTKWCKSAFDNFGNGPFMLEKGKNKSREENNGKAKQTTDVKQPVVPIFMQVMLLNENHEAIAKWDIYHAWPKAWKMGELNAERGEVLIETIEIQHNGFIFKPV